MKYGPYDFSPCFARIEVKSGVGFAAAGRHLYQGSWAVFGEGVLEVGDGFYLAFTEVGSW